MKAIVFLSLLVLSVSVEAKTEGRFQLYTFPQYVNRSILLDTHTGRMWTDKCIKMKEDNSDCKLSAWTENDIVGLNTDWKKLGKEIAEMEKGEANNFNPDEYLKKKLGNQ